MSQPIRRFEELVAWQKARILTAGIYRLTEAGALSRDFGLKDQLRRSAVSIMSNLAEGFERGKPSEFHQFLSIAKGSCGELRSQLYVAVDAGYIESEAFGALQTQVEEVGRILGGLRASIERKRDDA